MKRLFILSSVISIVCFASCTKDITPKGAEGDMTKVSFVASQSDDNTKAQYNYNSTTSKYNLAWSNPDALNVFVDSDRYEFANSSSALSTFSGKVKDWSGNKAVYAVWPAGKVSSITSDIITVDAPTTATVGADNYSSSLLLAKKADVSSPSGISSMSFKQAMAIIKLQVLGVPSDATVTKVVLSTTSNILATAATVNVSDGTSTATSSANSLEFAISGGVQSYNTIVNLAVFPTTTPAAYTIEVYSGATKIGEYTTGSVSFARNGIYSVNIDCCNVEKSKLIFSVAYMANGNAKDVTNTRPTINGNRPTYAHSQLGYVSYFDRSAGCTPYFTDRISGLMTDGYTIECFAYPKSCNSTGIEEYKIFTENYASGYSVYLTNNCFTYYHRNADKPHSWVTNSSLSAASYDSKWIHLICRWNKTDNKMIIFANGTETSQKNELTANGFTKAIESAYTSIGSYKTTLNGGQMDHAWNGYIGQIRVWNTALSDSDINELFNMAPSSYDNTESHWN